MYDNWLVSREQFESFLRYSGALFAQSKGSWAELPTRRRLDSNSMSHSILYDALQIPLYPE
jgi:hypothetical protein